MVQTKKRKRDNKKAPPDFQRKKAKVGKKLAPANVTKTTFQARAIHVPTQLEPTAAGEATVHGLSLSDLLKRCGHYSPVSRKEAMVGLKQLFDINPQLVSQPATLMRLTDKLAPRFTDTAHSVRRAAMSVLESITPHLPSRQLAPFFGLYLAHTCSAMTKLESDIRADSLEALDIWIDHYPNLTAQHTDVLLPNLIMMFTGLPSAAGHHAAMPGRGPAMAMVSVGTRLNILRRLLGVLELVAAGNKIEQNQHTKQVSQFLPWDQKQASILRSGQITLQVLPLDTTTPSESGGALVHANALTCPKLFHAFCFRDLFPGILDMWLEYGPASLTYTADNLAGMCIVVVRTCSNVQSVSCCA